MSKFILICASDVHEVECEADTLQDAIDKYYAKTPNTSIEIVAAEQYFEKHNGYMPIAGYYTSINGIGNNDSKKTDEQVYVYKIVQECNHKAERHIYISAKNSEDAIMKMKAKSGCVVDYSVFPSSDDTDDDYTTVSITRINLKKDEQ